MIEAFLFPVFRSATPLMLAAMGGVWCERSGVTQIALEGIMLIGAFFGAVAAYSTGSAWLGFAGGMLAGMIFSSIYGVMVLHARANQIVAGMAMNFLAMGVPPVLSAFWYGSAGSTPMLPESARFEWFPIFFALASVVVSAVLYSKSRFGLRMRFAGEHPKALATAGVSVLVKRWQGVLISGALAAAAGAALSLCLASSYSRGMSAGRGFIALAAVILGKWKPIPTALACLLFGVAEAAQIRLQGVVLWGTEAVPVQFIQMLPYIVTLVVLAGFVGRAKAPEALGHME
jgi:general nucleoside transport system permease protein